MFTQFFIAYRYISGHIISYIHLKRKKNDDHCISNLNQCQSLVIPIDKLKRHIENEIQVQN